MSPCIEGLPVLPVSLSLCSVRLQTASESLLLHNLELSSKQEVVSRLWRSLHYPVIEVLRKQLQGNKSKGVLHSPSCWARLLVAPEPL